MRKLAVKERGNMSRLSVSSIKLIPFLNEDTKYDVDLCNWVYQIVYTRSVETADGDVKIIPMGDVSKYTHYLCTQIHFCFLSFHMTCIKIISRRSYSCVYRCSIMDQIIKKLNHRMMKKVTIMPTQPTMSQPGLH